MGHDQRYTLMILIKNNSIKRSHPPMPKAKPVPIGMRGPQIADTAGVGTDIETASTITDTRTRATIGTG